MNKYVVVPSIFFVSQLENLNVKVIESIYKKLLLLEINPNRNKSLIHKKYNLLRIRLANVNKEIRIIYCIKNLEVRVLFMLNRKNYYNDLEKYLKKVQEDLE